MIKGKVVAPNVDQAEWIEGMKSFTLGLDQLKNIKDMSKVEERIQKSIKMLVDIEMKSDKHPTSQDAITHVQ